MFKISVCMIVKNEEKFLERCLESLKKFVDEIIIVDTGSIDRTIEIAKNFTEKIYSINWENDFSKARNFSISKASYDWIFVVDADEIVFEFNKNDIKKILLKNNKILGRVEILNIFKNDQGIETVYKERISRFFSKLEYKYQGSIHEQLISIEKNNQNYKFAYLPLKIKHYGYTDNILKEKDKINRNLKMLLEANEKYPKDIYIRYQLGKTYYKGNEYKGAYLNFKQALYEIDNFSYEYVEDLVQSFGYTLIKLGKYKEALELEKFSNLYMNSSDYNFMMGLIFMNNAQFTNAIKSFENAKKNIDSKIEGVNSYLANYNIGIIYEVLGYKKEAKIYYEKAGKYEKAKQRLENI